MLVDSVAATSRAWAAWGARHGLDGAAIQAGNHGRPARAVVAEHVPPHALDAEAAFLLDAEVADTDGVDRVRRARPACSRCPSSRSPRRAAPARARAPRRRRAATSRTCSSAPTRWRSGKPAPDPYLLAAERLGVDPAACLVLEDAPSGVAAGRAAGMTVLGGHHDRTRPAQLGAAHRIAAGLPALLSALSARAA